MTKIDTVTPPNPEFQAGTEIPTISVDRALGHAFGEVNLDVEQLRTFYDSLPHEDKPPLGDLRIHLSGTHLREANTTVSGILFHAGTRSDKLKSTPELPKTCGPTMVIYAGTALSLGSGNKELLNEELNNIVTHELTHYAQRNYSPEYESKIKTCVRSIGYAATRTYYRTVLSLIGPLLDGRWAKAGALGFGASEVFTDNSVPKSLKVALGAAAITHLLGRKSRLAKYRNPERSFEAYLQRDDEVDARAHEYPRAGIVQIETAGEHALALGGTILPVRSDRKPVKRLVANRKHRILSSTSAAARR